MRIKITFPGKPAALITLPDAASIADVRAAATEAFALHGQPIELRSGFPPELIPGGGDDSRAASSVSIRNGCVVAASIGTPTSAAASRLRSSLIVNDEVQVLEEAAPPRPELPLLPTPPPAAAAPLPGEEWPCAACTFANGAAAGACDICSAPRPPPRVMQRVVIPADNSCLFTAAGFLLVPGQAMDRAHAMRKLCIDFIRTHEETYTEAMLGAPTTDYCAKLARPETWGGGVELEIFALRFGMQLVAFDIKTGRPMVCGPAASNKRAFLLYDGIHWDAIVGREPGGGAVTVFSAGDAAAEALASGVAQALRSQRQYTDLAGFDLRCGVCGAGIKGEKGAQEHATATKHQNFQEYVAS